MITTTRELLSPEKPQDPHDRFFWLLDRINSQRKYAWEPEFYESDIRELGQVAGGLYTDWLKVQGLRREAECYDYLMLPYISFRFLSAPKRKEVNLFKVSPAQRRRFVELVVDDMQPVPDVPSFGRWSGSRLRRSFPSSRHCDVGVSNNELRVFSLCGTGGARSICLPVS